MKKGSQIVNLLKRLLFPQIEGQSDYDSYLIMNQPQQASQFSFSRFDISLKRALTIFSECSFIHLCVFNHMEKLLKPIPPDFQFYVIIQQPFDY